MILTFQPYGSSRPRILARDSLVCDFRDRGKIRCYRRTRSRDPTRWARNEGVAIRAYRGPSRSHLRSSIIVNPKKRERARAELRVGHKAAWRRTAKTGHGTRGRPVVLVSGFWFRPVSFYDVTRGSPPRPPDSSGGSEATAVVARIRRSGDSMLLSRSPRNDNREKRNV